MISALKNASETKTVYKCNWMDVKEGDTVYLFARNSGMPYALGPFTVFDPKDKILRSRSGRIFKSEKNLYRKEK